MPVVKFFATKILIFQGTHKRDLSGRREAHEVSTMPADMNLLTCKNEKGHYKFFVTDGPKRFSVLGAKFWVQNWPR
jgi:hypothetical protein